MRKIAIVPNATVVQKPRLLLRPNAIPPRAPTGQRGSATTSFPRGRLVTLLAFLLLLPGCATTLRLSDEDRHKIKVVKIDGNVVKPARMYYMGPGTSILIQGGAAGGAVAGAISAGPGQALQAYAERNGIFIEKIVDEELAAALRQSGKVKVSDSEQAADATIYVAVTSWGFSIPQGFSSNLVPVLAVLCHMVDAGGKTVWRASDSVLPLRNPANPTTVEAMSKDPKLIEKAWRAASRQIAGNIAKTL